MSTLLVVTAFALGLLVGSAFVAIARLIGERRPQVIGALRERCEICGEAWAVTPGNDDELALCKECDERWYREVLR